MFAIIGTFNHSFAIIQICLLCTPCGQWGWRLHVNNNDYLIVLYYIYAQTVLNAVKQAFASIPANTIVLGDCTCILYQHNYIVTESISQ